MNGLGLAAREGRVLAAHRPDGAPRAGRASESRERERERYGIGLLRECWDPECLNPKEAFALRGCLFILVRMIVRSPGFLFSGGRAGRVVRALAAVARAARLPTLGSVFLCQDWPYGVCYDSMIVHCGVGGPLAVHHVQSQCKHTQGVHGNDACNHSVTCTCSL